MKVKEKEQMYDKYITTHFEAMHEREEGEFETYYRYFNKNYSKHMPKDKISKILDIGCGMGHCLYFFEKEGYKNYLGIDISKENIAFRREKGFSVELCYVFDHLKEKQEVFDVIVMNDIIEHLGGGEWYEYFRGV